MGNKENKIIRKVTGTEPNLITENEIIIGGITWSFQGKITSYNDAV